MTLNTRAAVLAIAAETGADERTVRTWLRGKSQYRLTGYALYHAAEALGIDHGQTPSKYWYVRRNVNTPAKMLSEETGCSATLAERWLKKPDALPPVLAYGLRVAAMKLGLPAPKGWYERSRDRVKSEERTPMRCAGGEP